MKVDRIHNYQVLLIISIFCTWPQIVQRLNMRKSIVPGSTSKLPISSAISSTFSPSRTSKDNIVSFNKVTLLNQAWPLWSVLEVNQISNKLNKKTFFLKRSMAQPSFKSNFRSNPVSPTTSPSPILGPTSKIKWNWMNSAKISKTTQTSIFTEKSWSNH